MNINKRSGTGVYKRGYVGREVFVGSTLIRGINYYLLIFSFLRRCNKAKRGLEFGHSTRMPENSAVGN